MNDSPFSENAEVASYSYLTDIENVFPAASLPDA